MHIPTPAEHSQYLAEWYERLDNGEDLDRAPHKLVLARCVEELARLHAAYETDHAITGLALARTRVALSRSDVLGARDLLSQEMLRRHQPILGQTERGTERVAERAADRVPEFA